MKRLSLLFLMSFSLLTACKKDEDKNANTNTPAAYKCTTCPSASEAKAEYDNSSAGVYKGVMVGSTGTIALYLYNTGTEVKALVVFDGKSATLTCTGLGGWAPGQAISGALFTGVVDGKTVTALFSVDADGKNPNVDVQIPGHDVVVAVYKETSATLIKNYEGTYSGDDNGVFNMTVNGNQFLIIAGDGDPFGSTLVNGNVDISQDGVEIKGTFSGEEINGTWKNDDDGKQGTWTGKRTL